MSFEYAVEVDNLSKCYQIYNKPQDRLKQSVYPRLQRLIGRKPIQYFNEFWALKGCSLKIKSGETVGIIGRNGAGKSTLLQLICGTLNPTFGEVNINGRVAALLELGSGFNPEFTGRENVYLNAAILGLMKAEIDEKFELIERFADIGAYIDQPVKTYSSGMVVRLAFAVIAHVDADILVVDEALAVGDAIFIQKCMRFIKKFKRSGTLLFVSHDTNSVINLCDKALWLHEGEIRQTGKAKEVAEEYLQFTLQEVYGEEVQLNSTKNRTDKSNVSEPGGSDNIAIDYKSVLQVSNQLNESNGWKTGAGEIMSVDLAPIEKSNPGIVDIFKGGEKVRLTVKAIIHQSMKSPILGFLVRDKLGQELFGENTLKCATLPVTGGAIIQGEYIFRLPMLPNGQFSVTVTLADGDLMDHIQHHWAHDVLIITVSSSKVRYGLVGLEFEKVDLKEINGIFKKIV
jgi:lipopolysaccharide transport system ATP-binding protein